MTDADDLDRQGYASYRHPRTRAFEAPVEPHVTIYGALWLVQLDDGRIVIGTLSAATLKSDRPR